LGKIYVEKVERSMLGTMFGTMFRTASAKTKVSIGKEHTFSLYSSTIIQKLSTGHFCRMA
jgi:hypothetical protein